MDLKLLLSLHFVRAKLNLSAMIISKKKMVFIHCFKVEADSKYLVRLGKLFHVFGTYLFCEIDTVLTGGTCKSNP